MSIFLSNLTFATETSLGSSFVPKPTRYFATSSNGSIVADKPILTGQIFEISFNLSNVKLKYVPRLFSNE